MDDNISIAQRMIRNARSRIPERGYLDMNLSAFIASLTDLARTPIPSPATIRIHNSLEKQIKMFAYLRDKYGARTPREAHQILRGGKVPSKVIESWIEDRTLINEAEIARAGYPQYSQQIDEMCKKDY